MKHFITILTLCTGIQLNAGAQTFTQRIQQPVAGQGTVTIHQSAEIDQLVNSETLGSRAAARPTTSATPSPIASAMTAKSSDSPTTAPTPTNPATTTTTTNESNTEATTAKKIMRGYKVSGYRVQAFAGGNSRTDRQQAESVGNKIKASFPEEPVYVHFYSPRWICRVGNYRTYEEAHQMLVSLRKIGFTQATIVKGKITVPYE